MPRKDPEARREYNREYQRIWYRKNKALHIQRVAVSRTMRRELLAERINSLKNRPCADCGGCFPPCAMDFDHVSGDKVDDVCGLLFDTGRWERILAEIAKCELVCANCHRIRTHVGRRDRDGAWVRNAPWFVERYVSVSA
jgi:hypothetical protein